MPAATATVPPAFLAAYDAVLDHWPTNTTTSELVTAYGTTHLLSHGPEDAPPVLLLPGGGATATGWYAMAAALGRNHRVHAVDLIGEPGRSVPAAAPANPLRTADDLTAWLHALLDGLRLDSAAFVGHSYGAWIALHHALRAPERVDRLVLLDPTNCFTGFSPRYLLRALPMLLRPTPARNATFLRWETRGADAELDPAWLRLLALAAEFPSARPVTGPRPTPAELGTLKPPTLLLLAERSRAHDSARMAARARAAVPRIRTATLPGATHHTLPAGAPPETYEWIEGFLKSA
ncbi:alpha/beta fold hydrolase [Streptomyces sp. P9(2023)]|uniref:alpha/beta fold hydrolase n=1 Tax=Streptomyces sp. P9(2023) TaxID=3064394 RepID=UPI0028F44706|nr:alpha/beta fold hydrolase [Streptomyces sp. P9(2023)]MDT9688054.1 alpha/beta fold hydrolase [Streptomyces sp. P9(2023)]